MTTIYIEGLIWCGKSTTLRNTRFPQLPDFYILEEPLKEFQYFKTQKGKILDPLATFYKNPFQEGITCQLHILKTYKQRLLQTQKVQNCIKIWDRGPDSTLVFTRTLHKEGHITEFGYEFWLQNYIDIKSQFPSEEPSGIFFIDLPVVECLHRQKKRGRLMENDFTFMHQYLNVLRESYIEYISEKKNHIPVEIVNEILTEKQMADRFTAFIQKFVK